MRRFMQRVTRGIAACVLVLAGLGAPAALAQELHTEDRGIFRAEVVEVTDQEVREVPGTETEHLYQTIRARVLEGPQQGEVITIENDYLELEAGDRFYFNHSAHIDGTNLYGVIGIDRTHALFWLVGFFVAAVVLFGGWQGVRALLALAGSFLVILYVLLPGLLEGWSPLLASFVVAAGVLFAAIFFTHGFNRESMVAFGGTMLAVLFTGVFAIMAVDMASLSGFASEESVYLNFNTRGTLDFTGLLLGAIIIGALGVLDDIAVTQAAVVGELYSSRPDMSKLEAYRRAIRVGREHVGALVNTLVLAYTGAALPLLLLFYLSSSPPTTIVNMEIFATEIVRMIAGSIGLILAVPIVTGLAVWFLHGHARPLGVHGHTHGRAVAENE